MARMSDMEKTIWELNSTILRLEARLAAVEALCDAIEEFGTTLVPVAEVRAVVRGEGDRA